MKKHPKHLPKTILLIVLVLCINTSFFAQNLYVQPIGSGVQEAFAFADKPKITFSGQTLNVASAQATKNFPLNEIQNFSFVKNEVTTGIALNNDLENHIRLFPNPVEDVLTLEVLIPMQGFRYRIFDMGGKQLTSGVIQSEVTSIQMQNYRTGVYVISIDQNGQLVQSFRIIKQ
jgi:hypothetical protein